MHTHECTHTHRWEMPGLLDDVTLHFFPNEEFRDIGFSVVVLRAQAQER